MRVGIFSFLLFFFLFNATDSSGQTKYSTSNAHSHNDYERPQPFWAAWQRGFGSIEADIFLHNGKLIVAHTQSQLDRGWTLDSLYLQPLLKCINDNKGKVYADSSRHLQLMIDIKTAALPTLEKLIETLKKYPALTNTPSLKISISGNRPPPAEFSNLPSWIFFDGELKKDYSEQELSRIVMLSDNFANYSSWKGKGNLPENDRIVIKGLIDKAHRLHKKVRFWNAPDILSSWYTFIELGVDYINTDYIEGINNFLLQFPDRIYVNPSPHSVYQPKWRNDGTNKPVKNIILLIGDGTGLAQWYAGYTANRQQLNTFNMRHTGLSKTSSFDNYITDSAPGATAFSSGVKTNNRAVGVDHTGTALPLLPRLIRQRKMKTGLITSGDLRDATPAAFYAHQSLRSNFSGILKDLLNDPVDLIMGSCNLDGQDSMVNQITQKFDLFYSIDSNQPKTKPVFVADKTAALSILKGRGEWLSKAFQQAVDLLSANKNGFLLMLEAAQVDRGGHINQLPVVVTELLDFDKVIGKAMEFADSNGETLIIVTGDHETGGLTLTGGDYEKQLVSGQFSTRGHTAIPVPVFAYGPQSQLFDGTYENTEIYFKILKALNLKVDK